MYRLFWGLTSVTSVTSPSTVASGVPEVAVSGLRIDGVSGGNL